MAPRQILTSVEEVIEHLGGTGKVARLTGSTVPAVCNWRTYGRFPATMFLVMTQLLRRRGAVAPPGLWSQRMAA